MMKKTFMWTILILFGIMAASTSAQQQAPAGDQPQGQGDGRQGDAWQGWMPPWVQSLPPEKKAVFERIFETRTNVIFPLALQLRAQQAQLRAELAKASVDQNAVDQILEQINGLDAQINRAQVDLLLEIKKEFPQAFLRHAMMASGMGMGGGMGIMSGMGMMGGGQGMMGGGQGMMGGGMGMMGGGQGMMGGGQGMMGGGQGMMGGPGGRPGGGSGMQGGPGKAQE